MVLIDFPPQKTERHNIDHLLGHLAGFCRQCISSHDIINHLDHLAGFGRQCISGHDNINQLLGHVVMFNYFLY